MTGRHEVVQRDGWESATTLTPAVAQAHPLHCLSGHHPAHVLAAWGLVSLLPGATLSFTEEAAVPVLRWEAGIEQMVQVLAESVTARTWGLGDSGLEGIQTTTPTRSQANSVISRSWGKVEKDGAVPVASLEAIWDVSASDRPFKDPDLKVHASDLTMLSGRSYTSNCLQEAWELLGATDLAQARECARRELELLLSGRTSVVEAKPGLRFSASHPTPRTISGSERCDGEPFVDILAFCGQILLCPLQREKDAQGRRYKVLTWVLNPLPLTIEALVDLHESPPAHLPWSRWSAPITQAGSSAKISYLDVASEVTPATSKVRFNA